MELKDNVAVITGGGSGIGAATARLFAEEGAKVLIADWDEAPAQAVAQEIAQAGGTADAVKVDVSDQARIAATIDGVVERWGQLDILVNNAGIARDGTTSKIQQHMWDQVMAVNLAGVFWGSQAALKHMKARGYGRVVNTASIAAYGAFGQTNYAASKAGVLGLTYSQALEFSKYGITINAIGPGIIDTPLSRTAKQDVRDTLVKKIPAGRIGQPEDIARGFLFLASPKAGFITGQFLKIDGGSTLPAWGVL